MGTGKDRLYFREDRSRWYMDLRDLGHGQRACIPPGEESATDDRDAAVLALARELEAIREREAGEEAEDPLLDVYADRHLEVKAGYRAESTIRRDREALQNVLDFFGPRVRLSEIGVRELTDYVAHRRKQPGRPAGTTISAQTILHELHALSSLYQRAVAEDVAEVNPVRRLPEKPTVRREEATWLEPGEAARLLEAAGAHDRSSTRHPRAVDCLRPLVATFLLTGGRRQEVFGLLRRDLDVERSLVWFRPNDHRTLKTEGARRWVPLWPQLREILEGYLERRPREPAELLFPSPVTGKMLTDVRKSLAGIVQAAEIAKNVSLHTFRHTYTATRIQTTDGGAPVGLFTVARELGHQSTTLIQKTYGHLQRSRSRREVVACGEGRVVGEIEPTGTEEDAQETPRPGGAMDQPTDDVRQHRPDCPGTAFEDPCWPLDDDEAWGGPPPPKDVLLAAGRELVAELGESPPWCRIEGRAWELLEETEAAAGDGAA